jgi:hypothetical protein
MEGLDMTGRILLVAMLMILGGCASYRDAYQERFDSLPQHYSQFDLKMAWEMKVMDSGTAIDGMVKNIRYFEMDGIEIWVSLLDGSGKTLGRSMTFIIPRSLSKDDQVPFSITVPARAVPGTRLRFTYSYLASEGMDERMFWMQSFEAAVPNEK